MQRSCYIESCRLPLRTDELRNIVAPSYYPQLSQFLNHLAATGPFTMSSNDIAPTPKGQEIEEKYAVEHIDKQNNFKEDAVEAENREQAMTIIQAVKAYPAACAWAFTMSSTIVSIIDDMSPASVLCLRAHCRSWRRTVSS